jgi:hypothetical protein
VKRAGDYAITLRFSRLEQPGLVSVSLGGVKLQRAVSAGAATASFDKVRLELGAGTLESYVTQGDREVGMLDVVVERRG